MRRRSASAAATIRPRDARTSASCDRTSAARRSFSSTSAGGRANGFHERRLVEQRRIVDERGDLFAACRHRGDGAVGCAREARPAGPRHRRSGRRRVDTRPRASGRRARGRAARASSPPSRVRSSTTSSDACGRRSRDQHDPRDDPSGNATRRVARAIVSSVGALRVGCDHPAEPREADERPRRPPRRAAAPARGAPDRARRAVAAGRGRARRQPTADAGDLLRPVDRVRDIRLGGATDSRSRASGATNAPTSCPPSVQT